MSQVRYPKNRLLPAESPRGEHDAFGWEQRAAFLAKVRTGSTDEAAAKQLGIPVRLIKRFLFLGREAEAMIPAERDPTRLRMMYEARSFYLDFRQAQADAVLALERVMEEHGKADSKNWKAIHALLRVRDPERWGNRSFEDERRVRKANLAIAESKAATAQAIAEIAKAKARIVMRDASQVKGAVYLAPEFVDMMTPEERAVMDGAMKRLRLERASDTDARAAASHRTVDNEEAERLKRLEDTLDRQAADAAARKLRMSDLQDEETPDMVADAMVAEVDAQIAAVDGATPPWGEPPIATGAERVLIVGGPRTGKTTLAKEMAASGVPLRHTDDLIDKMEWSQQSDEVARWLSDPGPWIIEGVAAPRALRKWLAQHPEGGKPCDRILVLFRPKVGRTAKQETMAKGVTTVWYGVVDELVARGVLVEEMG